MSEAPENKPDFVSYVDMLFVHGQVKIGPILEAAGLMTHMQQFPLQPLNPSSQVKIHFTCGLAFSESAVITVAIASPSHPPPATQQQAFQQQTLRAS